MGDAWIVLAVVVVLTMVALVGWSLRRRRPEAVDELAETPPPADLLDVPITESIPSSGLLVPIQSTESLTLGVMLREELERSKQAPPPFTLDYRTISAELIPGLGDLRPLPERSALARVMKELDQHIRPESSAKYSGKTVTLLRSNVALHTCGGWGADTPSEAGLLR